MAWALTLLFFVLTLVPFRAPNIQSAIAFVVGLGSSAGSQSIPFGINAALALGFVIAYHVQALPWTAGWRRRFVALPDAMRGLAYGAAIAFLLLQTPPGSGVFIYQQF